MNRDTYMWQELKIREYQEPLQANKPENLDERNKFQEKYDLSKPTREKNRKSE